MKLQSLKQLDVFFFCFVFLVELPRQSRELILDAAIKYRGNTRGGNLEVGQRKMIRDYNSLVFLVNGFTWT